jgi:hypothetical protein
MPTGLEILNSWEMWVTVWAFVATIVTCLGLGWLVMWWWKWINSD